MAQKELRECIAEDEIENTMQTMNRLSTPSKTSINSGNKARDCSTRANMSYTTQSQNTAQN